MIAFARPQGWGAPAGLAGVDPRAVQELCAELAELYPDPVDVFEDALAERLGLCRHPACDLETWRRMRVRGIDALEAAGDAPQGDVVREERGARGQKTVEWSVGSRTST